MLHYFCAGLRFSIAFRNKTKPSGDIEDQQKVPLRVEDGATNADTVV